MNLDAVRTALLADAQEEADSLVAEADHDAEVRLADAVEQAVALIAAGHAQGAREAAERLARQRASARREARRIVLSARCRALDELRERVHVAARELATDDGYQELQARLGALALEQVGADGEISFDPGGEPGVIASDGHRRVDYRLVTLADRAIDALGAEVSVLWR